jgi:ATP-binding protein involved in chromosome partitioning
MLGLDRRPEVEGERMIPLEAWGLRAMSIGFLVDEDTAMIWRGPMVMGALVQLMEQVAWGAPDVMVIDMPPGTGDVALTLSQRVRLAGAVIVSTPQDLALVDARRAVAMFRKTGVPILGVVENMSYFSCPHCGQASHVFGHGGAREEAARLGVPFLGELPLLAEVRAAGDSGTPIMASDPDSAAGRAFHGLALQLNLPVRS